MNELESSLEDLVPWAVDRLALLETELCNFVERRLFSIFSNTLDVSLSTLACEKSFTQIGGILRKLRWKTDAESIELRGAEGTLYPLYLLYPSIDYITS